MYTHSGDNPGRHHAGELVSATMQIRQQISSAEAAAVAAWSVASGLPDPWRGSASLACAAMVGRLKQHLDKVTGTLHGQLAGVERYRVDLDRISRSFMPFRARIEVAQAWIDNNPRPLGHGSGVGYVAAGSPSDTAALLIWERENTARREELAACNRAVEGLRDERRTTDLALLSALQVHRVSGWKSARQLLVDAGIPDPRRAGSADIARVMASKSKEIISQDRRGPARGELQDLLDAYGYSAEFMDAYFRSMDPSMVLQILSVLPAGFSADDPADPGKTLPSSLRAAYALASQGWGPAEAQIMAAGLLPDYPSQAPTLASPAALGYVLSGATVGTALIVSVAQRLDTRERRDHHRAGHDAQDRLQALAVLESGEQPAARIGDPAGLVFSQLARHPGAAFDFLTGPEGTDRVKYWYGRDWSGPDQFQGVLELWSAASRHPQDIDTPEWNTLAGKSGAIINTLAGNEQFTGHRVSETANQSLTMALMLQLPGIIESSLLEDAETSSETEPTPGIRMPDGSERQVPAIDEENLARVLSVVYNSGGAMAMTAFATEYSSSLADYACSTDNPIDQADTSARLVQLHALLGGVEDGVRINQATELDDRARLWIKPLEVATEALPIQKLIPGFAELPDGIRDKVFGLKGDAAGSTNSVWEHFWARNAAQATSEADGREEVRSLSLKANVMATLAEALDMPVHAPVPGASGSAAGGSTEDYRTWIGHHEEELDDELRRRYKAMTDAAGHQETRNPPTVAGAMAGYEASYEHFRETVTK